MVTSLAMRTSGGFEFHVLHQIIERNSMSTVKIKSLRDTVVERLYGYRAAGVDNYNVCRGILLEVLNSIDRVGTGIIKMDTDGIYSGRENLLDEYQLTEWQNNCSDRELERLYWLVIREEFYAERDTYLGYDDTEELSGILIYLI